MRHTSAEREPTLADRLASPGERSGYLDGAIAVLALAVIVFLLLGAPHGLMDKADRAAYAVCHRIPERSFWIAGRPLPLCARCSGTYLGTLSALAVLTLRRRGRASRLPAPRYLGVFAFFMLVWAVDGFNSFLTLFPGLSHLYEPRNILRLVTGALEGLALGALLLAAWNATVWAEPDDTPSVESWRDLAWMLTGGAMVIVLVTRPWEPLLMPLALLSSAAIVGLVATVNTMLVLMLWGREEQFHRLREAAAPIVAGLALSMGELALVGMGRSALEAWLGWPF
jgi:uncharacterized membrane protein